MPPSACSETPAAITSRGDAQGSGADSLPESNCVNSVDPRQKKRKVDDMSIADEPNLTRTEPNLEDILMAGAKPHLNPSHRPVLAQQHPTSITLVTRVACRYAQRSAHQASGKGCEHPRLRVQLSYYAWQAVRRRRAHGRPHDPRADGCREAYGAVAGGAEATAHAAHRRRGGRTGVVCELKGRRRRPPLAQAGEGSAGENRQGRRGLAC